MGTLGTYLQEARNTRGIDLREAAQQTRISIQYLKALEAEDFSKLPGEVFVRGFLKNYGKFLNLDESEVMKRYAELRQKPAAAAAGAAPAPASAAALAEPPAPVKKTAEEKQPSSKTPIEPFIWGAGIIVILIALLFTALPRRHAKETPEAPKESQKSEPTSSVPSDELASKAASTFIRSDKLYLEVSALENTWLLVRTDSSPQKKAVLNKGESLIWSADERFLLSYGSAGALRLRLNGQELTVNEPKNAVIRDLTITAAGIENRTIQAENARQPKPRKPLAEQQAAPGTAAQAQRNQASASLRQSMTGTAVRTAPTGTRLRRAVSDQTSPALRQSMTSTAVRTAPSGTHARRSLSTQPLSTVRQGMTSTAVHTAPAGTEQKTP